MTTKSPIFRRSATPNPFPTAFACTTRGCPTCTPTTSPACATRCPPGRWTHSFPQKLHADAQGEDFLTLTLHFAPERAWLDALPEGCAHTRYGCYTLNSLQCTPRCDCEIARMTPKTEPAARAFDLAVNGADMGEDFVARRFDRRALVYRTGAVERWLCRYRGRIVCVCDLFVHDGAAKLEDFDVHPGFQRQGFGTALLHALARRAQSLGAHTIYLVTDEADTAREMYVKNGFQKTAEKHEFLFISSRTPFCTVN